MDSSGSTLFVTGESHGAYATVAYDARTGSEKWVQYEEAQSQPMAIALSPDGKTVYVTGMSVDRSWDFATVAYNAVTGARLWFARGGGVAADHADAVQVSLDGKTVFVAGDWENEGPHEGTMTIAYKARTGGRLWASNLPVGQSFLRGLALSADGNELYVMTTAFGRGGRTRFVTAAYDARSGAQQWTAQFEGPRNTLADAGALVAVGNAVLVTGFVGRSVLLVAYGAMTGTQLWESRYKLGGLAEVPSAALSPDGRGIYVLASEGARYPAHTVVIAVRTRDGGRLWMVRRGAASSRIALSSDGRTVYVMGEKFQTMALAAKSGEEVWTGTYAGSATPRFSSDIATDPLGRFVFLTGTEGRSSRSEYATLAYRAH